MVGEGVDARHSVEASGQTASDIGSKDPTGSGGVQALEEREDVGVRHSGLVQRSQLLNDDVGVTDGVAGGVHLARSSKEVGVGVDEVTGVHMRYGHRNSEVGVRFDGLTIDGVGELRRREVSGSDDSAHLFDAK